MMRCWLLLCFLLVSSSVSVAQMPGFESIDCGGSGNYTDKLGLEWRGDEQYVVGGVTADLQMQGEGERQRQYRRVRYFPAVEGRKYCYRVGVRARTRYLVRASFLYGNFDGSMVFPEFGLYLGASRWSTIKVMQTAVVGTLGALTYRLDLHGFPANGWAATYLAEIEDDAPATARRFKLYIPGLPEVSKPTVDIGENAPGKYRVYQPGYDNITLPFVLPFAFRKTDDSARGPILNAMEIYAYVPIIPASPDAAAMDALAARYPQLAWAREGGDPCVPSPWSCLRCSASASRVLAINLSGKNLTGGIPPELAALPCLQEIRLDNNMLTGPIPDLSASASLSVIHFENNQLDGIVPSYLSDLPKLTELYVQNNELSGVIPSALLSKSIVFQYSGNAHLRVGRQEQRNVIIGISALLGTSLLLAAALCCYCYVLTRRSTSVGSDKKYSQQHGADDDDTASHASVGSRSKNKIKRMKKVEDEESTTIPAAAAKMRMRSTTMTIKKEMMSRAGPFELSELEEATNKFARRIGSGGFGVVYYGRLRDGREIAVKVARGNEESLQGQGQGRKQLANEVALLSRIHHRNLVAFLGYCCSSGDGSYMLVYEFMHNGSLKEQLHRRPPSEEEEGDDIGIGRSWVRRLQVAEDAAKGIEYLHCGCTPAIIHRDIKTSNILLDEHMRAKVSDLGLSKATSGLSMSMTTHVRGTLGYLDPHYYVSQQLTEKSDLYSFGIILLELISGRPPILIDKGGGGGSLGPWAKSHYESGDIEAIVDPSLRGRCRDVHSVWKVAETAVRCIDADPRRRPSMPEVVKDIQEAIALERPAPLLPSASCFSPAAGALSSSATVRSHDLIMDNLMYGDSSFFCDSLNLHRTPI
uniref:non-specific serine/threonine protein kinase n=1 Tax=Leersia perrieri TaxID=77586 RepID=A0A0D9VAZ4_9ORYZ